MIRGIMNVSVGAAGQPGYCLKGGDTVNLVRATNLPVNSKTDYYAARDDGSEDYIGISEDDVRIVVDWNDIEARAEHEDGMCGAPWEECDGYEHEIDSVDIFYDADLDDLRECRGYVPGERYRNGRIISIDDDDIINKWGFTHRNGESKQVWLEKVARVKRKALDQLVKWYSDGWSYHYAVAEFDDYSDSCGGILSDDSGASDDYVAECVLDCQHNVADEMEDAGYIIENRPAQENRYNLIDHHKARIKRNLDMS